jgi:hypothetical protein
MSYLFFVKPQGLSLEGLPLALLKAPSVDADIPRLAAAQTRPKQDRKKMCKRTDDIEGKRLRGVVLSKRVDSLEAVERKIGTKRTNSKSKN